MWKSVEIQPVVSTERASSPMMFCAFSSPATIVTFSRISSYS